MRERSPPRAPLSRVEIFEGPAYRVSTLPSCTLSCPAPPPPLAGRPPVFLSHPCTCSISGPLKVPYPAGQKAPGSSLEPNEVFSRQTAPPTGPFLPEKRIECPEKPIEQFLPHCARRRRKRDSGGMGSETGRRSSLPLAKSHCTLMDLSEMLRTWKRECDRPKIIAVAKARTEEERGGNPWKRRSQREDQTRGRVGRSVGPTSPIMPFASLSGGKNRMGITEKISLRKSLPLIGIYEWSGCEGSEFIFVECNSKISGS